MRLLRLIIISLIGLWPTVNAWSQIPPFFNNLQYWTRADSISALGNPNIVVLPDFSDGLHNAPIQSGATQATLLFEGEFNVPALQFSSATRYNLPNINVKSAIVVCKITDYPASGTVRLLTRNAAANGLYNAFNGYLANFTGASCGGTRTILSTNPKYVIYSVSSGDGTNPGVMRVDFTSQLIDRSNKIPKHGGSQCEQDFDYENHIQQIG